MILGATITGAVGILCLVLGYLIWIKEKITLLHNYHYSRVKEDDKKAFCRLSGIGVIAVGIGALVSAVLILITDSALSFIGFGIGFAVGIAMLIYAGRKYNR